MFGHVLLDQLEGRTCDVKASAGRDGLHPHLGSSQKASRQNGSTTTGSRGRSSRRIRIPRYFDRDAVFDTTSTPRPDGCTRDSSDTPVDSFATKASLVDDVWFLFGVRVWY